eukprot:gene7316-436_t
MAAASTDREFGIKNDHARKRTHASAHDHTPAGARGCTRLPQFHQQVPTVSTSVHLPSFMPSLCFSNLIWNQCGRGLLPLLFLLSLALHALANPDPGTGPGLVNSATTPTVTQAFLTTTAATGPGSGPGPGEGTTMPGVTHTIPTLHHHEIDVDALPTQPTNLSEWRHDWDQYRKHLCATHVGGIPLCDLMGGVAHYDFNVSLRQLKRSHGYNGENCRARRLVQMLMHGKSQVNIGVIGASVSWGAGSSMRGLTDWVSLLTGAVQQSYPAANFTVHNGCFPGSQSFFANMCLSQMAPDNIDLMVIDYMTTDFPIDQIIRNEKAESFERMLRKALKRPTQMAVVQLQFLLFGQAMNPDDPAKMRFHQTSEDLYDTLAQYYTMPVISFTEAFQHNTSYAYESLHAASSRSSSMTHYMNPYTLPTVQYYNMPVISFRDASRHNA